jgi:dolichol-phosphate mannosyltransferase
VVAAGLSTVEVPIEFVERERGYSKMDAAIVAEALWRVSAWGAARLAGAVVSRARSRINRLQER